MRCQAALPGRVTDPRLVEHGHPGVPRLGFGVLTAPKGTARTLLDDLVTRAQPAEFVRSLDDDDDLATT